MPATYTGALNANELYAAIYNMIISQQVFADNVKGTTSKLADMFRVDGSLYGDTKLYYSTDVLGTHPFPTTRSAKNSDAANLLAPAFPDSPFCQKVVIDTFRQIRVTTEDYISKRAWSTEGAFAQFNSVMLGWLGETKKVYDSTLVNAFVGSESSSLNGQSKTVSLVEAATDPSEIEAQNRIYAEAVAKEVADTFVELTDINRMNDLSYLRSYDKDDLLVVWNANIVNKIKKYDLPSLFHKEGLIDKFEEVVLPARYFSTPQSSTLAISTYAAASYDIYANEEMDVKYVNSSKNRTIHLFPGDKISKTIQALDGTTTLTVTSYTDDTDTTAQTTFKAYTYRKDPSNAVACKIIHKDAVPFMSAFETGTSFFNARILAENHYLTYGHNTLVRLYDKPFVTISVAVSSS